MGNDTDKKVILHDTPGRLRIWTPFALFQFLAKEQAFGLLPSSVTGLKLLGQNMDIVNSWPLLTQEKRTKLKGSKALL